MTGYTGPARGSDLNRSLHADVACSCLHHPEPALLDSDTSEIQVEEITVAELRAAVERDLATEGITIDELRAEADTGHFTNLTRRLIWIAASALDEAGEI